MCRSKASLSRFYLISGLVAFLPQGCGNATNFANMAKPAPATHVERNGDATAAPGGTGDDATANEDKRTGAPDPEQAKQAQMRVIEREFSAGAVASDSVSFSISRSKAESAISMVNYNGDPAPQPGSVSKTLPRSSVQSMVTMGSVYSDQTKVDAQVAAVPVVDPFTQGGPSIPFTQTFTQSATKSGPIDILVVIDNSGSMSQEQANLATKLSPLLSSIAGADWQISVVTTDPRNGCQRALIKSSDGAAAATAFQSSITSAGLAGDGNERGILMSVAGLMGSFTVPGVTAGTTIQVPNGGVCPATAPAWLRANAGDALQDAGSYPMSAIESLQRESSRFEAMAGRFRARGL